ncbi:hypothetical protein H5P28_12245 [Ruficoccus amylovorans]|uniref:Uncharacterized protein n=1 Tax=Ruficoccus amylovorans TaxID=1804625 RepID=A0A842HFI7_9BACT|nr:hypothetical protein [Ruficoccus amylovorans]MBC2595029.1 hypothetical protein [Ruficoccus amylovorans]
MDSYPLHSSQKIAEKTSSVPAEYSSRFKSLATYLTGKNNENEPPMPLANACSFDSKKDLEVIEKNGVIELIRVRCACGEVTEIRCSYDLVQQNGTADAQMQEQ